MVDERLVKGMITSAGLEPVLITCQEDHVSLEEISGYGQCHSAFPRRPGKAESDSAKPSLILLQKP
jgi:hypothetical protein